MAKNKKNRQAKALTVFSFYAKIMLSRERLKCILVYAKRRNYVAKFAESRHQNHGKHHHHLLRTLYRLRNVGGVCADFVAVQAQKYVP